jgi:hypothetical protein
MKAEASELRMPADKFDGIMRKALQTKPPAKEPKAAPAKKKARKK